MKRQMTADVTMFQSWPAPALEHYITAIDNEIKRRQHLKAAAMKAQRIQRKQGVGDEKLR